MHKKIKLYKEDCCATGPVVAQGHKLVTVRVNATGWEFDTHSRKWNIFYALVSRQAAAWDSATQHAIPPEFGGK